MVYVKKIMQIKADNRIAQMLLLTYFKSKTVPIIEQKLLQILGEKVFWQTINNNERSKLKLKVNGIEISCLLDSKVDVL